MCDLLLESFISRKRKTQQNLIQKTTHLFEPQQLKWSNKLKLLFRFVKIVWKKLNPKERKKKKKMKKFHSFGSNLFCAATKNNKQNTWENLLPNVVLNYKQKAKRTKNHINKIKERLFWDFETQDFGLLFGCLNVAPKWRRCKQKTSKILSYKRFFSLSSSRHLQLFRFLLFFLFLSGASCSISNFELVVFFSSFCFKSYSNLAPNLIHN